MASDALSLFKDVRIVPLEVPVAYCQSGSFQDWDRWSTEQAIRSLGLCFDDKTVKSIIGTGGRVFGYIGCSKRSCFLCGNFIKAYGG